MKGWFNRWHSEQAKDLNISIERYRYRHSQLKRYADDMIHFVLDPILNKGYNINELSDRSEMLYNTSHIFRRKSTSLRYKLCRENCAKRLIIFMFILFFIYFIIGITCGFAFQCMQ